MNLKKMKRNGQREFNARYLKFMNDIQANIKHLSDKRLADEIIDPEEIHPVLRETMHKTLKDLEESGALESGKVIEAPFMLADSEPVDPETLPPNKVIKDVLQYPIAGDYKKEIKKRASKKKEA